MGDTSSSDAAQQPGVLAKRRLGQTSLMVTGVCVGGAPLASMPQNFGEEVDAERGMETVRHVFDGPLNFLDTSNGYGGGESERRIGTVIAERGGLPDGFVLATKLDRDPRTGDFGWDRMHRSAEESLRRLGLARIQLLYLHDPEHISFGEAMAPRGPVAALVALRDSGVAQHIGVAGGPVGLLSRFAGTGIFEVLLTHNRFTLIDRSAEGLIDEAAAAGLGVVNAAPYGGGILAKGTEYTDRYAYRKASPDVLRRVRRMEEVCSAYGVPLAAAALSVSLEKQEITSTVVGTATPRHVDDLVHLASAGIPVSLQEELAALTSVGDDRAPPGRQAGATSATGQPRRRR